MNKNKIIKHPIFFTFLFIIFSIYMYVILQYGNAKVAPIQKKDYRNWKMENGKCKKENC